MRVLLQGTLQLFKILNFKLQAFPLSVMNKPSNELIISKCFDVVNVVNVFHWVDSHFPVIAISDIACQWPPSFQVFSGGKA